jgi:hypothetical protein
MSDEEPKLRICRLCRLNAPIDNSHILPAFAFRWLRKRGISPHIRGTLNPNRRSQDGEKSDLLCRKCEDLFGNFERGFSSHAFYPAVKGTWNGRYERWLLKFCVSVSWRVLVTLKGRNPNSTYTEEQERLCAQAESSWRDFLLSRTRYPGPFVQQTIFWGEITGSTVNNLPRNINRYLSGPIEMDIVATKNFLATYAKLGPFMIFGIIQAGKEVWKGTQVKVNGGLYFETNKTLPKSLEDFINDRANKISDIQAQLSPTQKKLIAQEIDRNIDTIHEKPQFSAMLADARLFGLHSIITPSEKK